MIGNWLNVNVVGSIREIVKGLPGSKRSPRWPKERKIFITLNPSCAVCGKKKGIQVHHIKPFHLFPWLELVHTNFISLCRVHHFIFGHLGWWKSWNEMVVEDCRIWQKKFRNRPSK